MLHARAKIFILLASAVIPVLLAWGLFFGGWRSEHTTNRGKWVQPMVSAKHWLTGAPKGWSLVWLQQGHCDQVCLQGIETLGQVRKALGRERMRVRVAWIGVGKASPPPGVLHGQVDPKTFQATLAHYQVHPGQVYIMDPLGYVMLTYPTLPWGKALLHDVKHLLKVSHIG